MEIPTIEPDSEHTPWRLLQQHEFVSSIIGAGKAGHNFVPFIGSGMSAPSGILMGAQLKDFLGFVVMIVLGLTKSKPARFWDIRTHGWPSPTQDEMEDSREAIAKQFEAVCNASRWKIRGNGVDSDIVEFAYEEFANEKPDTLSRPLIPEVLRASEIIQRQQREQREALRVLGKSTEMIEFSGSPAYSTTSKERIEEYAIRSLHDWRATLKFLSRIIIINGRLRIGEADNAIIDSFNAHIIGGKRPNFGHTLLAHLAEPLRFRTLLTTNFDTLLEEAFQMAKKLLRPFEVSIKGHLPAYQVLQAQNSLVKLHGGLLETRADLTLDEVPDETDCQAFSNIFSGKRGDGRRALLLPAHLLVLGYSANDLRCVRLMKAALDHNPKLKIFWVCYNENDESRIKALFREKSYNQHLFYCVTRRPDLLLYELYQTLTLCLPGGGISYHYAHRVPPEFSKSPLLRDESSKENLKSYIEHARKILIGKKTGKERSKTPFIPTRDAERLFTIVGKSGVAAHAEAIFNDLRAKDFQCVWLELQDFQDAYSAICEFLRTIALRRGNFQLEHLIYLLPLKESEHASNALMRSNVATHLKNLCERLGIAQERWWLFLYGRNEAGACAGWGSGAEKDKNWKASEHKSLAEYLDVLTATLGFNVLYMPSDEQRTIDIDTRLKRVAGLENRLLAYATNGDTKFLQEPKQLRSASHFDGILQLMTVYGTEFLDEERNTELTERPFRDRIRFLYGLTLFRQSRHASSLCMAALYHCPNRFNMTGVDNDALRTRWIRGWITELTDVGVLYRKPGGTLWMYRDVRLGLRQFLESLDSMKTPQANAAVTSDGSHGGADKLNFINLKGKRSRMQFWIGEWYQQAFNSTGNHLPLVEAVFHYSESALHAKYAGENGPDGWRKPMRQFEVACNAIIKLLMVARPWLKFWMQSYQAPSLFHRALSETGFLQAFKTQSGIWEITQSIEARDSSRRIKRLLELLECELRSLEGALDAESGSDTSEYSVSDPAPSGYPSGTNPKTQEYLPIISPEELESDQGWYAAFKERSSKKYREFTWIQEITEWVTSDKSIIDLDGTIKPKLLDLLDGKPKSFKDHEVYEIGELLGEFCYTITRRATLLEQFDSQVLSGTTRSEPSVLIKRYRVAICATALAALSVCNRIHPFFLKRETSLRLKILDLYGLALAQLGRFYEAHRRFDLVLGVLSKIEQNDQESTRARTELRKAEAHLLEARKIRDYIIEPDPSYSIQIFGEDLESEYTYHKNSPRPYQHNPHAEAAESLMRLHTAKVDDAWVCLENAAGLLSGKNHSSLWWGRLITLQLQCYGELSPVAGNLGIPKWSPLTIRRRIDHVENIIALLEHGNLISPSNIMRRLRFLEHAVNGVRSLKLHLGEPSDDESLKFWFRRFMKQLEPGIEALTNERFKKYAERCRDWFIKSA